jgi:predicted nuclease of predicted toxin-antitoxin system
MQFKIDENLPIEVSDLLRHAGHDAATVLEQRLGGAADPMIAAVCQRENRILVTLDLDFADIRSYPPAQYPGLIVLRVMRQDKVQVLETLSRLLPVFSDETPEHALWIVEEDRVRIRF